MSISEVFLTAAEQLVRQAYFRSSVLQRLGASRSVPTPRRVLRISEFQRALEAHGLRTGDVVMLHSALSKLAVIDDRTSAGASPETEAPVAAAKLLAAVEEIVGDSGTIVVPTFPKYPNEPAYLSRENDGRRRDVFDPATTPSKSGLLTEVLRTAEGSLRSRYPLQTISARGPHASWLVGEGQPVDALLHGPKSPYGRLVEGGALVISLGVPLIDYCTVVHAAEDARFETWPVRDFWRERVFDVREGGDLREVRVLERTPRYSRGYAEELLRRDARRHGVLSERVIGNVECHALRAPKLYEMMMEKNRGNTYPFLWPRVSRL